jgi:hypothetical protein
MDSIVELARRELHVSIGNNLKPLVARELRARHPALKGPMETRPLGRKRQTFTIADLRKAHAMGYEAGLKARAS